MSYFVRGFRLLKSFSVPSVKNARSKWKYTNVRDLFSSTHHRHIVLAAAISAAGAKVTSKIGNRLVHCTSNDIREVDLGHIDNFPSGEMHTVKVDNGSAEVLITNINDKIFCTGNTCSHYNASLEKGIACKSCSVICPWHAAEFDLNTGKPKNGPGLDGIPVYPVNIKEGRVIASLPLTIEKIQKAIFAKRDLKNKEIICIVGAGASALTTAETLREEGYTGRIIMYGKEPYPPYDRPIISKNLQAKPEKIYLRSQKYLEDDVGIEFQPSTEVKMVDIKTKTITIANGNKIQCDKIVLATGGKARILNIPGSDLKNIKTLRSINDALEITEFGKLDNYIVVIGTSFIGTEIAASLSRTGAKVTVIGNDPPLSKVLGNRIGEKIKYLLNPKGVIFRNATVTAFKGKKDKVCGVQLDNGEVLQADLVVLGVGVEPNTDCIIGVDKLNDKSIKVNSFMQVEGCPNIYAVGDIATFPYYKTGDNIRIEHWTVAMQHGRIAAQHIMGKFKPYDSIPFFWSMIMGKSIRYAGYCNEPDEILIEGDIDNFNFCAMFIKNNKIQAVATSGKDPVAAASLEAIKENFMPNAFDCQLSHFSSQTLLKMTEAQVGKEMY